MLKIVALCCVASGIIASPSAARDRQPPAPQWHRSWKPDGSPRAFNLSADDLHVSNKASTLLVHLQPLHPEERRAPAECQGRQRQRLHYTRVDGPENDRRLAFHLTFSARPEPLVVGVPLSILKPSDPHQLILRYAGYRVEFFVDGVLMDEEWPLGSLGSNGPATFAAGGAIDAISVWPEILPDGEIAQLNGGEAEVARRADALLGPEAIEPQYWKPRGYNVNAGDAMPFYHDGVFHLFYLVDRRHHHSKWGLGAHQWAHISSTDLVHWTHYPLALAITDEQEASICTGSVFFHGGKYYAFYATRKLDRTEHPGLAISSDGIHFEKILPSPLPEPQEPFKIGPNRDPYVYRDGPAFRMLVTAELAAPALFHRGGALEQLVSEDLSHWTMLPKPFLVPGYNKSQPECSDLIFWRGWYYLFFGMDGATHYRMSRTADGPWITPPIDTLDSAQAHVMKVAQFGADRQIGVAWIANGTFGGELLFRELTQSPDGTLGTKFVPEMIPAMDSPLPWRAAPMTPGVSITPGGIVIHTVEGTGAAYIDHVPQNARITAKLTGKGTFGIVLRSVGSMEGGVALKLVPALHRAEWLPAASNSLANEPSSSINGVDGLDRSIDLDIVAKGDIFDASINGTRTLVRKEAGLNGDRLFFYVQGGELTDFESCHSAFAVAWASTSSGVAVPVPFFIIVIEATKFPKAAARSADPVTAKLIAAPAEKLSPAPQISTGFSTGRVFTHRSPASSTTITPSPACVTKRRFDCVCRKSAV